MQGREISLKLKATRRDLGRKFRQSQIVADVLSQIDLARDRYLIIEDDRGELLGIVETDDLLERVASTSPIERRRWADMPLGSAIGARLNLLNQNSPHSTLNLPMDENQEIHGTSIATASDDLAALMLGGELYLRWNSIKSLIDNAFVDALTGLPNRLIFERRVEDEWSRLERNSSSLCVIMVDLDHFKEINDQYGHVVGDQVLREVGVVLRSQLRSYDLLSRYGGDEFAAVLSGCTADQLEIPIGRMQEGVRQIEIPNVDHVPRMTLSIGAAMVSSQLDCTSTDQLINQADECLYKAKANGRDCAYTIDLRTPRSRPTLIQHSEVARTF